jgi:glycosyltransferase involved in cell wall biosynthesis
MPKPEFFPMTTRPSLPGRIVVSIGILARNEETRLGECLAGLFRQTLFAELARRGERAEIWCVANGCTDDTAAMAERLFHDATASHPHAAAFLANAVSVRTPGKINAWNLFVHEISATESQCLILMDADIRLGEDATLWKLFQGLEENGLAQIAVGEPVKDIALKTAPSLRERISLATSRLTQGSGPQLTGQLYAIRAATARRIRLPRDLAACEDGFIKNVVCTDFLVKETESTRLLRVPGASHVFEAYVTAGAILRNQKRQMIGQTFVHLLLDRYLPALASQENLSLGEAVKRLDEEDPQWLRRLVRYHIGQTRYFWELFPGVCSFRYQRWANRPAGERLRYFPAMVVGSVVTMAAAWMAWKSLRGGLLEYWPDKPARPSGPPSPAAGEFDLLRPAPTA